MIRQSFPNYESESSGPVKMYLAGEFGDAKNGFDSYQGSSLYAVDRLCTMAKLKDFYKDGGIIIFDRYVQSNMIHQAGKIKDEKERDKFLEWVDDLEFEKLKLPRPEPNTIAIFGISFTFSLINLTVSSNYIFSPILKYNIE